MQSYARVALYSCLINLSLTVLKFGLGEISGSLALRADAIHSLGDVVSNVTIFLGIIIANRKTSTFPEGLYKVENLVALLSSFLILYAAFEIASDAIQSADASRLEHVRWVIGGIVVIILSTFLFSRYELRVGLEVGSPSLVADAKHVYADLLSTFVVLISVVGSQLGYFIDRYVALFVAILVARAGFQIMVDALKVLLEATLDHSTLDGIRKIMERHPDVGEVVSIGGRNSGRYKFVEISLSMRTRLLREAHSIVSHLEEEILDRWPEIDRILIHYEPETRKNWFIAVPIEVEEGKAPDAGSNVSKHFGDAPFFAVLAKNMASGNVHIEVFLENTFRHLDRHKGVRVAEFLAEKGIDEVITRESLNRKGSGYTLEALQIATSLTPFQTLSEVMEIISQES